MNIAHAQVASFAAILQLHQNCEVGRANKGNCKEGGAVDDFLVFLVNIYSTVIIKGIVLVNSRCSLCMN